LVQAGIGPAGWSAWQTLALRSPPAPEVLAEILDGGQTFRWHRLPGGEWQGAWSGHLARLRAGGNGTVEWSAPAETAAETGSALAHLLDAGRDPRELADLLPWRSDPHLARCIAAFPGLRILRQPLGEALLGFLCSATKRIVQIKQMAGLLAERHGRPLLAGAAAGRALPSWAELAEVSEAELRACKLGFRARHVHGTARFLAANPGWLEETGALPYPEARVRLCLLPGVGEKVADCVLLYGANQLEAFPVDVWIIKVMARRYGLEGWRPGAIAHFGRVHFGPLAGVAQQYLFAWERGEAKAEGERRKAKVQQIG
jgi:N-glycosylase/DNA lyase